MLDIMENKKTAINVELRPKKKKTVKHGGNKIPLSSKIDCMALYWFIVTPHNSKTYTYKVDPTILY